MSSPASVDPTETRAPAVRAVCASTLACCSVFVFFRVVSRFAIVKKPGWDDYTMILAWLLAFGTSFAICWGTTKGLGTHESTVSDRDLTPMYKSSYVFSVLYNPALMATKSSILIFYLSLSKTNKIFRWATIITLVVVNVGGLALTFLNIFQCSPVQGAFYSPEQLPQSCTSIVTIYLSSAPLNIITDLAIFFLPMPLLTAMRLPRKQKVVLVVTFGFGIFVAVVDVIRIYYLQDAARDRFRAKNADQPFTINPRDDSDFSWYVSFTSMWSAVEINTGIMCACVPTLKPLVKRFLPKWVLDQSSMDHPTTKGNDSFMVPAQHLAGNTPPVSPMTTKPPPVFGGAGNHDQPSDEPVEEAVDMMDFLTSPDMDGDGNMPGLQRLDTAATCATTLARRNSGSFFDFVDMQKRKNITLRTNSESAFPVAMVTILFFVWGFAYGLLDALNVRFQVVAGMSNGQTIGQHSAYYFGYAFAPMTFGRLVFRHWGFKACYIVGLCVYACGALIFWPSAVLTSFPAFLISNFITGCGLSTLELGANPFIALCGPPEYAEARLCMSQGLQAIGTVLSPLLAQKVLFRASNDSLVDVQWAYLGISFFTVILAVIFLYVPLPEATDDELEDASARLPTPRNATVGSTNVRVLWVSLGIGIVSMFCYVGGQESTSTNFNRYLSIVTPNLNGTNFTAIEHTGFAISRLLVAFACIWIKPRLILAVFFAASIGFTAATMSGGVGGSYAAYAVLEKFFEGPIFPLIFAQSFRGMGRHTKGVAVLLTAAISGGAVWPPIMYAARQIHSLQYSYCVVIAAYSCAMLFPIWLNLNPAARKLADPVRDEHSRRASEIEKENRESMGISDKCGRWTKFKQRLSKDHGQLPCVEHRERSSWPETLPMPAATHHNNSSAMTRIMTPVFLTSRPSDSSSMTSNSSSATSNSSSRLSHHSSSGSASSSKASSRHLSST